MDARPAIVGYDGSPASREALRQAAVLLRGRPLLVVTIWEPGLAQVPLTIPAGDDLGMPMVDPETALAVDDAQRDRARHIAGEGVALARELGAEADAVIHADAVRVGETLLDVAHEHDAAVLVVGTHGHGRLAERFVGSTAQRLVRHADLPVLVVHASA